MASVSAEDVVADKYRVERLLGRGGMGYVVAARHLTLDQLVAIKFLRRGDNTNEDALARFRREAKACVRLKNEHVAKVYDVGIHNDEPFIVMEHLEGADLGAITKEGQPLGLSEASDHILQACSALAEAHSLGIIHRDIKLPNLFVTEQASGKTLLKVLDFGVSKLQTHEGDVTRTAAVLGSPKYMSPEQMNDPRNVDARTDVWSLGVCLFRLVTGVAPFDGDTIGRLCTMVLHEQPPLPSSLTPIPREYEAIILCALQKDRAHRFANVAELAAALVPFSADQEAARERVQHIASVLGVDAPPPGFVPPLNVVASTDAIGAWAAHTAKPAVSPSKKRTELAFASVAVAVALVLTVMIGRSVLVHPPPQQPVAPAASPVPPPPVADSAPLPVLAPPPPAPTPSAATTVRALPPKKHVVKKAPASNDAVPGDRK